PATGPCSITKTFDVGKGCTLNFSGRNVTIGASGQLNNNSTTMTIVTRNFTIAGGGYINGRSTSTTSPGDLGGYVRIQADGNIAIQKNSTSNGRIDMSGNSLAGGIELDATGTVTLSGQLRADSLRANAGAGTITINAGTDIVTNVNSLISAVSGDG